MHTKGAFRSRPGFPGASPREASRGMSPTPGPATRQAGESTRRGYTPAYSRASYGRGVSRCDPVRLPDGRIRAFVDASLYGETVEETVFLGGWRDLAPGDDGYSDHEEYLTGVEASREGTP
jgi:hypothetical protein